MSSWTAHLTGTPGLWVLKRDGLEVGTVALTDDVALRQLHVDNLVRCWNHPPPPETWGEPAATMLEQRRRAT